MNIYINSNRNSDNASQSESIDIREDNGVTFVNGYQKYYINEITLQPVDEQLILKQNLLKPIFEQLSIYDSFVDIGASNGYFTFLAKMCGFKNVTCVEHDVEYIKYINIVNERYPSVIVDAICQKFSHMNSSIKYDIVCMLALIHWIYSCTEINNNIDNIFNKLSKITKNVLIIEWIDPTDPAVKAFDHISYNKDSITGDYTEESFVRAINKYFNSYMILPVYRFNTRKIYICFKDFTDNIKKDSFISVNDEIFYRIYPCNSLDNGTSEMYITKDKKQIMKKIVHYKNDFVYERDIFWLERLADEPFIPTLLYKDDINKRFILKYFGDRININNKPDDWRQQLTDILSVLTNKYGWSNNDLKHTEILVSPEGKIGIVDFGWCMLNNDYTCEKGFINNKFIPKINDIFYELESRLCIKSNMN